MNRIEFFDSISGINYPNMLVNFFDHFLALKEIIIENSGIISVIDQMSDTNIIFNIEFSNKKAKESVIDLINNKQFIVIYERPIYIKIVGIPTDSSITLELH